MPRHHPQISALPAKVEKSYTVNGFINLVYNLLQTIRTAFATAVPEGIPVCVST